ncbi:NlpC/P60 family protein [Sporosarcina thermotolerans]|uniref:NlpC/P60 family protein n=1 Tax=Sporosarcina thermotolerans TaxID=633404 RepID=A0AAW9A6C1_9BACL|nr:NlpC/P60 family protein [Sporosarcina thermotolerans]MDW0116847.1 NlpC/P60 family protein [Sporosarcina thermotolerans]
MKKVALSLIVAGSLAFGFTTGDAEASSPASQSVSVNNGTYTTAHNVNIRSGAGTGNKIVLLAKKGTEVSVVGQKNVGKEVWYNVKVNGKTGWALSTLLTKNGAATKTANNASVVQKAKSLTGIPYRFGGTSTKGFDCSGFVQYVYKQSGKSVSRDTLGQFAQSKKVSEPKPGDLVFFQNTYRKGISHVGIYIGNNKFVHAGGKQSQIVSLSNSYWKSKFHSFKRL